MRSRLPGSAHVIAVAALVVALSGTAYAAATVTSADIVDGTIKGADIRTAAVGSVDLKDGGVASADLADGGVQGQDLATGAVQSAAIADGSVQAGDLAAGVVPTLLWLRQGGPGLSPSSDGVAVTSHPSTGVYQLAFDRTVEDCALSVTPVSAVTVMARIAEIAQTPDQVQVALVDLSGVAVEAEFSVLAVCG